jgi:3-oxoacyl-[acyl-carrier protein] reductase
VDRVTDTDSSCAGIGQAIAVALAKSGADVALLDLDESRQDVTRTRCTELGVTARSYACNVLDEAACVQTFDKIEQDMGPVE